VKALSRIGQAFGLKGTVERPSITGGPFGLASAEFLAFVNGLQSKSSVPVTFETAIRVATILACARVRSQSLASAPLRLMQRQGRSVVQVDSHPAAELIRHPNSWMGQFDLVETAELHNALAGRSFWLKTLDARGEVAELLPLDPRWVSVRIVDGWRCMYDVSVPTLGGINNLGPKQIWHYRGLGWNGVQEWEPLSLAREAIGLSVASEQYAAQLFAQGVRPSGAFTLPDGESFSEEQKREFKEVIAQLYSGVSNAGRALLLENGMKWTSMAMTADDAQTIEQRKFAVEEACRFMGVAPIMVYSSDKTATHASAEAFFAQHDQQTVLPSALRLEQSADLALLSAGDRARGLHFKFNLSALARASLEARAKYFSIALGAGGHEPWMTVNEVREAQDYGPLSWGDERVQRAGVANDAAGAAATGEG